MSPKAIPSEALIELRQRLGPCPPRSAERRRIMRDMAALYGVSEATLYRALREWARPRALHRADQERDSVRVAAGAGLGEERGQVASDEGLERGERVAEDAEVHLEQGPDGGGALREGHVGVVDHGADIRDADDGGNQGTGHAKRVKD